MISSGSRHLLSIASGAPPPLALYALRATPFGLAAAFHVRGCHCGPTPTRFLRASRDALWACRGVSRPRLSLRAHPHSLFTRFARRPLGLPRRFTSAAVTAGPPPLAFYALRATPFGLAAAFHVRGCHCGPTPTRFLRASRDALWACRGVSR